MAGDKRLFYVLKMTQIFRGVASGAVGSGFSGTSRIEALFERVSRHTTEAFCEQLRVTCQGSPSCNHGPDSTWRPSTQSQNGRSCRLSLRPLPDRQGHRQDRHPIDMPWHRRETDPIRSVVRERSRRRAVV
jgi:hypothetical protein